MTGWALLRRRRRLNHAAVRKNALIRSGLLRGEITERDILVPVLRHIVHMVAMRDFHVRLTFKLRDRAV